MTKRSFINLFICALILQLVIGAFPINYAAAAGTTYYVDNTCSNNGNGTTQTCAASPGGAGPFNSLVSALSTITGSQAGNSLLLKAGETFREQATIAASGTSGGQFTIGSYGTGNAPIIDGANLLASGWSQTTSGGSNTITASPGVASDTVYDQPIYNSIFFSYPSFGDEFGGAGETDDTGSRFVNVQVPQNATITAASVTFTGSGATSSGIVNATITGQATSSPATFSTAADFASRTQTTSTVAWNNIPSWGFDAAETSPNISSVIQQIVDLPGWSSGHNLVLFLMDNSSTAGAYRQYPGYGDNPSEAPSLSITYNTAPPPNVWQVSLTTQPNQVFFNGTKGTLVNSLSAVSSTDDWYWTSNVLYVYSTSNPATAFTTPGIDASQRSYPLTYSGSGISYVTITNIEIDNSNQIGVYLAGNSNPGIIIGPNVLSTYNYTEGIELQNLNGPTVTQSTVSYNGFNGVDMSSSTTNGLFDRVTANYNCSVDSMANAYCAGIKTFEAEGSTTAQNSIVCYNGLGTTAANVMGAGIWFDTNGSGSVVKNNKVCGNNITGIYDDVGGGETIFGNVVTGNDASLVTTIWDSAGILINADAATSVSSTQVINNTISTNGYGGIAFLGPSPEQTNGCTNMAAKNNISAGMASGPSFVATDGCENASPYGSSNVYSYNDFGPNASNFIQYGSSTYYSTLASWQTTSGQTNNLASNPQFVSTSTNEFWLASSSPAIDTGLNLGSSYQLALDPASTWPTSVILDNQNNFGIGWDLGAYTYTQTTPPTIVITTPSGGATVSGAQTISATASAASPASVSSVQFFLDGSPLGTASQTSSPFTYSWNTTGASNGSHSISALATDTYGNSASSSVSLTVSNAAATPPVSTVAIGVASGGSGGYSNPYVAPASSSSTTVTGTSTITVTTSSLETELSTLLTELTSLEAQAGQSSSGIPSSPSPSSFSYVFSRNLSYGMTGNDVKELQIFLNDKGFTVSASGAGSPGDESIYFGTKTMQALARFQESVDIKPASGYFGPITRAWAAAHE